MRLGEVTKLVLFPIRLEVWIKTSAKQGQQHLHNARVSAQYLLQVALAKRGSGLT